MPVERKTSVFISYSRKDKRFARKLNDALEQQDIKAWVDWEDIPSTADWMAEITASIEGADALVFVLSPDSIKSEVCAKELELAILGNKKIIPVLYRDVDKRLKMHPKLAATNWVLMRPKKESFNLALAQLVESIKTDLGWVKQHTRLLQRAAEWNAKQRNRIHLLQGSDLTDAERWMADSTIYEDRHVTPLQAEYIISSRKGAIGRQRSLIVGVLLFALFSLMLMLYAFRQTENAENTALLLETQVALVEEREQFALTKQAEAETSEQLAMDREQEAQNQQRASQAQRMAAQAGAYAQRAGDLDVSTLLALQSLSISPSSEAEEVLRQTLSRMAMPITQAQHQGRIWSTQVSEDGQYFVSASADSTACVWTMDGGKKFCVQHDQDVMDAFLTGDNRLLVTGSLDGSVQFWDGESGELVTAIDLGSSVNDLDINRQNTTVVAGREDGQISIIELNWQRDGSPLPDENYVYSFSSGPITVVKFQPNGRWVGVGTRNGHSRIWLLRSPLPERGPSHKSEIFNLVFSPDGKLMVTVSEDSSAFISRAETGRRTHVIAHNDWVEDAAFGPDSSWFVTASDDKLVRVFDSGTGAEKFRMSHDSYVQRVKVSPNGNWIASTGYDLSVRVWDSHSGALMLEASLDGIGSALEFSPDGKRLIAGDQDGNLTIWDLSSLEQRAGYIVFPEFINKAEFDPAGGWMLFNTDDKTLWRIGTDDLASIKDGTQGERVYEFEGLTALIKISPNSQWVAVSEYSETGASRALLYNLETKVEYSLPHGSDISSLAISPDSSLLATTTEHDSAIHIWSIETGEKQDEIPFAETPLTLAYNPANSNLAIGFQGRSILWDTVNDKEIAVLGQNGEIRSLLFNQTGALLATASLNGSIFIWDMNSLDPSNPEPVYQFQQGTRIEITALDFSPSLPWLASAGSDGFVYLWDLETGQEVTRLPHGDKVSGVSFSPGSNLLATVSRKTVQFWDLDMLTPISRDQLQEAACARLARNSKTSKWISFFPNEEYKLLCPDLP